MRLLSLLALFISFRCLLLLLLPLDTPDIFSMMPQYFIFADYIDVAAMLDDDAFDRCFRDVSLSIRRRFRCLIADAFLLRRFSPLRC